MDFFEIARTNMVKSQLLPNNISNEAFIAVIKEIPRQIFVPENKQGIAYFDGSLWLGDGRYILPPMVFAKMIESLAIKGDESVLDIACGTGYSSAVLAKLCKKIVAVEANTDQASKAHLNLTRLGITNVIIIGNTIASGHEEGGPYNIIFINGAVKKVPQNIFNQLADGGKLVTILSKTPNSGNIVVYNKINDEVTCEEIFDISLPVIEDF